MWYVIITDIWDQEYIETFKTRDGARIYINAIKRFKINEIKKYRIEKGL